LDVSSFIEKESIVINKASSFTIALAILFQVTPKTAISHNKSSHSISQIIVLFSHIFLKTSIFPSSKIYIAFASSHSLKTISHAFIFFI
jgi:hypothetical protein